MFHSILTLFAYRHKGLDTSNSLGFGRSLTSQSGELGSSRGFSDERVTCIRDQ